MSNIPNFKLNTGAEIPAIALGTWESPNDVVATAVYEAIKAGYRHIDTAAIYKNEEGVGKGINKALNDLNIKRSEIFVTTKLWLTDFRDPAKALDISLEKLFPGQKDAYVDLYLMHWPFAMKEGTEKYDDSISFNECYASMEKLPESKARAIGVSNFTISNLKKLLATAKKTPATNQVELHTRLPQQKLVDFLLSGNYGSPVHDGKIILPQAYSPMARGNLDNDTIKKIADKHKCSPANVVLSWGILRHTNVLPKSVTPERIRANFAFIKLDQEDIDAITRISKNGKLERYCDFPKSGYNVFNNNEDSK